MECEQRKKDDLLCPADAIADAAQAFGQDDDITVLTLKMLPVGTVDA